MARIKRESHTIENDVWPLPAFAENNKIPGHKILEINRLQYQARMKELLGRFGIRRTGQIALAMGLSENDINRLELMEQGEQRK